VNLIRQSTGEMNWQELLPSEDLKEWVTTHRKPRRLWRLKNSSEPIVYRFVFPTCIDENGSHTPCYVGEGGDFGRLAWHFRSNRIREKRGKTGELILDKGWRVQGGIQNSDGDLRLEILDIKGSINLNGITLNQHSLSDPFVRRLLENWTILHAKYVEKLYPKNCGISQEGKDLLRKLKMSRKGRLSLSA
jgi:hypothetical protein